jgi:DNA repair protein RadC
MARHHDNGGRHIPSPHAGQSESLGYLTGLLRPLHPEPEHLAARLLYRFGAIGRIAHATDAELRQICDEGETWAEALIGTRQLFQHAMRERLIRTRLGEDRRALSAYLLMTMRNLAEERVVAIFADAHGFVIAEEILAEGAQAEVVLTPRRLFGRAMNLDARRIVLAHNHPSGNAEPSASDIEHTRMLARQAKDLGLLIDDHLVVGAGQVTSMKQRGLMG